MRRSRRFLRNALLFATALLVGSALGAVLTLAWDLPKSAENTTPLVVVGIAMTYAGFGAIPALIVGVPAVVFLKRRRVSRWPAAAALTIGGGVVGALLMFATFGMFRGFGPFEQLGAIAGASIGFTLGLLLFSESVAIET